jgi:hypothetical protein
MNLVGEERSTIMARCGNLKLETNTRTTLLQTPIYKPVMNVKCGLLSRNETYLARLLNGHAFKDFFRLPRFIPPHQPMCAEAVTKLQTAYPLTDA